MSRRAGLRTGLAALALLVGSAGCRPAEPPAVAPADGAVVVARVDGHPVTEVELRAAAGRGGVARSPDYERALEDWISAHVLRQEVAARGLDQSELYRGRLVAIRARVWRAERDLARDVVLEALQGDLAPDEDALRAHYEATRDRLLTTRLHLRQITVPDRDTIVAIRARVGAGEDFATLAAQANLDPALRHKSGDLGWLEQRQLPTHVIGPAHRLVREGEVSEPFRDREGRWNLVQLLGREPGVPRDFAQVKDRLARELRILRSREALEDLIASRRAALAVEIDREALASLESGE